jgi:hypothetical protein
MIVPAMGEARLIPPRTPRLKIAERNPRSWTNHTSPMEAGIRASIGAIAKPWIHLAAVREPKDLDPADQKQVTMRIIEVRK